MTRYTMEQREAAWRSFERKILPAGKTWQQRLERNDLDRCIFFLMNDVEMIARKMQCKKCGHCMRYGMVRQSYRCGRRTCRFEKSWKFGTLFYNIKGSRKFVHLVAIFGARLIFEDLRGIAKWSSELNVRASFVQENFNLLERILDSWTSPPVSPEDNTRSTSGYPSFIRNTPLEHRIPRFFAFLKNHTRNESPTFSGRAALQRRQETGVQLQTVVEGETAPCATEAEDTTACTATATRRHRVEGNVVSVPREMVVDGLEALMREKRAEIAGKEALLAFIKQHP